MDRGVQLTTPVASNFCLKDEKSFSSCHLVLSFMKELIGEGVTWWLLIWKRSAFCLASCPERQRGTRWSGIGEQGVIFSKTSPCFHSGGWAELQTQTQWHREM